MRAKRIVLGVVAPVDVDGLGALVVGTDAVAPVVVVGETAAGPAEDGDADLFQPFDGLAAVAVDIGDGRLLADPQAAIGAGTEVLGKVAMEFGLDSSNFDIGADLDRSGRILASKGARGER